MGFFMSISRLFRYSKVARPLVLRPSKFGRGFSTQPDKAPFNVAIVYNQSAHAVKSVVDELRSKWGQGIRIIQAIDGSRQPLSNVDTTIKINKWNDLGHFKERLNAFKVNNPTYRNDIDNQKTAFTAVWSGFAEAGETGRAIEDMGLIWTGTTPDISDQLEKMGFKQICDKVGASTPEWFELKNADSDTAVNDIHSQCKSGGSWMIKSIYGGGGVGTKSFEDANSTDQIKTALNQVIGETKTAEGIYIEKKIDVKGGFFQLEIEVDGTTVAHGTRVVWFNASNAKVVEIGCQDEHVKQFGIPLDLIQNVKAKAKAIAEYSNNNTRGTIEALIYKNGSEWDYTFIEMNRRPQVENEALAYLEQDAATGERRQTFVESFNRACGIPAPQRVPSAVQWVAHGRLLVGDPDNQGQITNHLGTIDGFSGPLPAGVQAESICDGEISATSNPQHGKVVITANTLDELSNRLAFYFRYRKPNVPGVESTYGESMARIVESAEFRSGKIASNETFNSINLPKREASNATIDDALATIADCMVNGYRPGEGVDPNRFPTSTQINGIVDLQSHYDNAEAPVQTPFSRFSTGMISYSDYIGQQKDVLNNHGGGWNSVAPRDTRQQAGDSESFSLMHLAGMVASQHYAQTGAIDFEAGGAQYQAGLIRGFNPWAIIQNGLIPNMMTSALIRSQWLNGLSELPSELRSSYYQSIGTIVRGHYNLPLSATVPMTFNNFHAGNFFGPNGSPQDDTTEEMLKAGLIPRPNWVFSAKFTLKQFETWVNRQIDLFERNNSQLRELRIKNPGQGLDYTADALWAHIQIVKNEFEKRGLDLPIVFIHNHDFNGASSHELASLLKRGQENGFPYIAVDAAYRKSGTHADNTIVASALNLTPEQLDHLRQGNHEQQLLESITTRFDSKESQMTPWDSDWAGGTEGSDIRIAKEYGLSPDQIETAKAISNEVFKIERAVTPFSEYKLRLGIAIMIEDAISSKSPEAVITYIQNGGKLKVGGDVLLGLHHWQSLIPKPPIVDTLLSNMSDELSAAKTSSTSPLTPAENASELERFLIAGFQQKGAEWLSGTIKDLTPLIKAPHVLHSAPGELPVNTPFTIVLASGKQETVIYKGRSLSDDGAMFTLDFKVNNAMKQVQVPNPAASISNQDSGPRLASADNEFGLPIPGEIIGINIEPGQRLKDDQKLGTVESMKMQTILTVPEALVGKVVDQIFTKSRTAEAQGDILLKMAFSLLYESIQPRLQIQW